MSSLRNRLIALLGAALLLSGCSTVDDLWLGGDDDDILEGERIAVLADDRAVAPDESIAARAIDIPELPANQLWPQAYGNAAHSSGHLRLERTPDRAERAGLDGPTAFAGRLVPPPVTTENAVAAMDGDGRVSVVDTALNPAWRQGEERGDRLVPGGGLAYARGRLIAVDSTGLVQAFEAAGGSPLWRVALDLPVRAAPLVHNDVVLIQTADQQTLALKAADGALLWQNRGLQEGASYLSDALPAASRGMVAAAYASGEITVLNAATGQPRWSDSLGFSSGGGSLQDVLASPVIAGNWLFAGNADGPLTAFEFDSGRRIWEAELGLASTPWLAGEWLFVNASGKRLVALQAVSGQVRWVADWREALGDDAPELLTGPVLAGGLLWLSGSDGTLYGFRPQDGAFSRRLEVSSAALSMPIVARGMLYVTDADGQLYRLQ